MKDQEEWESPKEPKRFPMDQLRKETGQDTLEEYAADFAAPYSAPTQAPVEKRDLPVRSTAVTDNDEEAVRTVDGSTWIGYTAILLSVISMFIYPVLLGSVGALLGILAYSQGQKALGVWSIILGLVSFAGYFLLVPLYS